jgi:hypothetical protein
VRVWRERRAAGPAAAHDSRFGPRDAPKITALRRDAVYSQITGRLRNAADLSMLVEHGDLSGARRLARELSDDLQLVLDGLGWGKTSSSGEVELDLPPEQLRRTFSRLRERAVEEREAGSPESPVETQTPYERALIVIETCDQVLAVVGPGPEGADGLDTDLSGGGD